MVWGLASMTITLGVLAWNQGHGGRFSPLSVCGRNWALAARFQRITLRLQLRVAPMTMRANGLAVLNSRRLTAIISVRAR